MTGPDPGPLILLTRHYDRTSALEDGRVLIGGRPARWLHYSQSPGGIALEDICYIVPDKGIAYIITCSALKGQLLHYRSPFEQAILSFKVHN